MPRGYVLDRSGNGNHGNLVGNMSTSTVYTVGKVGQALDFDGVDDAVNIPSSDSINSATGAGQPRSWGFWFYYVGGVNESIVEKYSTFYGCNFWSEIQSNAVWGSVDGSGSCGGGTAVILKTAVRKGEWTHIFFTYDGSDTRLYKNGVLAAGPTSQTAPSDNTYALRFMGIGGYNTAGKLDDVRIYNRALSAAEVLQLYNMGK